MCGGMLYSKHDKEENALPARPWPGGWLRVISQPSGLPLGGLAALRLPRTP